MPELSLAQTYSSSILVIVIALLTCLTINRGIYLYFDKKYKNIDERLKEYRKNYGYNGYNSYPILNSKTQTEMTSDINRDQEKEEGDKIYKLIKEDEKNLNIMHYRIQLGGSVVILLISMFMKKMQLKLGFMIGAFINIFYNSIRSWRHINEAEKFSITAMSLVAVVGFVLKFCG